MKSTARIIRSAWSDGKKRKSTGFMMHRQLVELGLGVNMKVKYLDVKRIHIEDGKQVGTVLTKGVKVKVVKTSSYPAWLELKENK